MPKAASKSSGLDIELLPKETVDVEENSFLHWALNLGRYLIIFTEIIAVITFVASIYLAKQKNDLKTSIKATQFTLDNARICSSAKPNDFCESRFRQVQDQINLIASLRSAGLQKNVVVDEFLKTLPTGITLASLTINGTGVTFSGSFPAEQQLQTLVESFNRSTRITGLNITDLTKEASFTFAATAVVNEAAFPIKGAQ